MSLGTSVSRVNVKAAIEVLVQYGGIEGDHHKAWVINQALRHLLGSKEYRRLVAQTKREGYEWDEGIAP